MAGAPQVDALERACTAKDEEVARLRAVLAAAQGGNEDLALELHAAQQRQLAVGPNALRAVPMVSLPPPETVTQVVHHPRFWASPAPPDGRPS